MGTLTITMCLWCDAYMDCLTTEDSTLTEKCSLMWALSEKVVMQRASKTGIEGLLNDQHHPITQSRSLQALTDVRLFKVKAKWPVA